MLPKIHPIDEAILTGHPVTPELIEAEMAKPLPLPGTSYWGDALRYAHAIGIKLDAECGWIAVSEAAKQMGVALASLEAVLP